LSNNVLTASTQLHDQQQLAAMLEKDVETQKKAFSDLTNNFSQVAASLVQTEVSLKASQDEVVKLGSKISDLEAQNQALDKQALNLSASITNLTTQIAETQKKLETSEGNKTYLEKELKRMMAEKSELERQFNDLSVLRAQVSKLKDELSVARRIEWIRQGLYASNEQKGAQKLMQGTVVSQAKATPPRPNYDLNVEVSADGSVKVIPPSTNAPTKPPAR
jgi:chromosome segregation ATPase